MISPLLTTTNNVFYNTTKNIEENAVLNRGITDMLGIDVPWAFMSNNKDEKRERFVRSTLVFVEAFMVPFLLVPVLNRSVMRSFGLTKKFFDKGNHLIGISNKELKIGENFLQKIETHLKDITIEKTQKLLKKGKNVESEKVKNELKKAFDTDFIKPLKEGKINPEKLRNKLINAKGLVLGLDIAITGILMACTAWFKNLMTEKLTGKTGFSAEYSMADKNYVEKKAEKHRKNKLKKFVASIMVGLGIGAIVGIMVAKSVKSKNPSGITKFLKEKATSFDYTDAIYASRITLFFMAIISQIGQLLAARDNNEVRDTALRTGMVDLLFFGGDAVLNSVLGKVIDKNAGTKLLNPVKNKNLSNRLFPPTKNLKEISKLLETAKCEEKQILEKTAKYATGLYWFNFATIILAIGFGIPKMMNKLIRKNVEQDVQNNKKQTKTF